VRVTDPSDNKDDATRDQLLRRVNVPTTASGEANLAWDDIALLVYGLAFAARPLQLAAAGVIARYGLMPRGAWILSLVSGGIVYPHELADIFQIGRSLISAELTKLSDAGLITSKRGADRRRTELALSEAGEAAVKEVRQVLEANVRGSLSRYSPDEIRLCAQMLRDLRQAQAD